MSVVKTVVALTKEEVLKAVESAAKACLGSDVKPMGGQEVQFLFNDGEVEGALVEFQWTKR